MNGNRIIDIKFEELNPTEPISLDEVKKHLIVTSTDDDDYLTSLIQQSRKAIEAFCAVSLVAKTITLIADLGKEWELPYGPVTGIAGVQTRTGTEGSGPGTYATLTSGWETTGTEFMTFSPAPAGGFNPGAPFTGFFQWGPYATPQAYCNRYKLIYTTGYQYCPEDLQLAILNEVAFRYENRGEVQDKTAQGNIGVSDAARVLAEPYQRKLWF